MPATFGGHHSFEAYLSVLTRRMAETRKQAQNAERQKRVVSDANKLMDLAADLQKEMQGDKSLSPSDLSRRAAEIEKLARSVQQGMRGES